MGFNSFWKTFWHKFLNNYELYIGYNNIINKITNKNCYNFNDRLLSHDIFKEDNILDQLINLKKDYVVLCQFWSLYKFKNIIENEIHTHIFPSNDIMNEYIKIKNDIIGNEPYNFIHYRYENDFTNHFKLDVESLDNLIKNIKFKNNNLKIFIATSNIKNLIDLNDCKYKNLLVYKNDDMLMDLNFEQRAFIDYMFGINSVECHGHRKSSFSVMINNIKKTNNYYA